jgi:hypothetical protein
MAEKNTRGAVDAAQSKNGGNGVYNPKKNTQLRLESIKQEARQLGVDPFCQTNARKRAAAAAAGQRQADPRSRVRVCCM